MVRTDDVGVTAFQNACRHRGVKVAEGQGTCETGFTCPFHGWCYGTDGKNTFVSQAQPFAEHNLRPDDLDLRPVRCETWGGCAWINLDDDAPPLRPMHRAVRHDPGRLEARVVHPEWWYAFRLPVNWKLAVEAFIEDYHVLEATPSSSIPGGSRRATRRAFDPQAFIDAEIHYLRTMSEGMAGMVHASDVQDRRRHARHRAARRVRRGDRDLGPHLQRRGRPAGTARRATDSPTSTSWRRTGLNEPMVYCFPNFFMLPMYSSASSYRFRPLGPEETLMEIWSLTRYPEGEERPRHAAGGLGARRPAVCRRSRRRTSRTCPASSWACTRRASSTCASPTAEGHPELRADRRRLPRRPAPRPAAPGAPAVNVYPLDRPIVDLGF